MKHTYKYLVLTGLIMAVSGCSTLIGDRGYFRDKSGDYVDETVAPDLVIPSNLKPVQPVELMVIPTPATEATLSRDDQTPRSIVEWYGKMVWLTKFSVSMIVQCW